jgi:hypothetical protein
MTNDEILNFYSSQIDILIDRFEIKEAFELSNQIYLNFGLWEKKSIENIRIETILFFILTKIRLFININDFDSVFKTIQLFDFFANGHVIKKDIIYYRILFEIELLTRQGDFHKALNCINKNLDQFEKHEQRARLLLKKGIIEIDQNYPIFRINSLSEALYEAEAANDLILIADIYSEISRMFATKYKALGNYFIRKSETIFRENKCIQKLYESQMYRAINSFFIFVDNPQNTQFKKEAERIISSINRSDILSESSRFYYDRIRGQIFQEEESLFSALNFYIKVNALKDICQVCDYLITLYMNNDKKDRIKQVIPIYRETAIRLKDYNTLNYIDIVENETK